ncbi:MAG: hypothetical protein E5V63_06180 [Mesorhizobium sp.]|nr:MAG: hypothetical protein E5V63_06180 [Mesorhizobium sp.]
MQDLEGKRRKASRKNRDSQFRSKNAETHRGWPANVTHTRQHHPYHRNNGREAHRHEHGDVDRSDGGVLCLHGERLNHHARGMLSHRLRLWMHALIGSLQPFDKGPLALGDIGAVGCVDLILDALFCSNQKMLDRALGKIESNKEKQQAEI